MKKNKVSVVFCSTDLEKDKSFMDNIRDTAGCEVEFIPKVGYTQITKAYNEALEQANTDMVILCHNDINIRTKDFVGILNGLFEKYANTGIIGLVGSNSWSGGSWLGKNGKALGHLIQGAKYGVQLPRYIDFSPRFMNNDLIPCVTCDGMFMAVLKSRIKARFDTNLRAFHFYDVMFTVDNCLKDVKCGITPKILALHGSEGVINKQWHEAWQYSKMKYGENFEIRVDIPDGGKQYMEIYDKNKKYK